MKNQELFDRNIGILVKAYFDKKLSHSNCCACAVGNLVAANMGYKGSYSPTWSYIHCVMDGVQKSNYSFSEVNKESALKQIASTGYTPEETAKIKWAFEMSNKGANDDDWIFNGLMAVCDTLMQIHEASTDEITGAKSLFVLS